MLAQLAANVHSRFKITRNAHIQMSTWNTHDYQLPIETNLMYEGEQKMGFWRTRYLEGAADMLMLTQLAAKVPCSAASHTTLYSSGWNAAKNLETLETKLTN